MCLCARAPDRYEADLIKVCLMFIIIICMYILYTLIYARNIYIYIEYRREPFINYVIQNSYTHLISYVLVPFRESRTSILICYNIIIITIS